MNQPVKVTVEKSTGILTLDRPKALNSLNDEMMTLITDALIAWKDDPAIEQVVIRSDAKHFCAGGDVRTIRDQVLAEDFQPVDDFFAYEYNTNLMISEYPKPYIALMNGLTMGGGLGVSAHGSHRVITSDSWASMPEINIGFITDVGISHLFQHLPGHPSLALGKFLGLTGYRLKAADMIETGLATHHVESFDGLLEAIIEKGVSAIEEAAIAPSASPELPSLYDGIEAQFQGSWEEIEQNLHGDLKELVDKLTSQASPSALVAATELFEANSQLDLAGSLDNEGALGSFMRREPDFAEGVRAVLVDKDQDPHFAEAGPAERYRAVLKR
ncbi:3-hydroxyisobutyryl-CoA hydrolase [Corynebacterium lubricantis]|uniref:3-hydroxyisobutyryl-CoA hydrolase n=1 Tax=Corynebacterium lubricantis TaxID=541095 RepID=UPI0003801D3C|nr:3-hydroxyisobutyryl-CoA hydrolase [Corynebacterium lubricantis]